LTQLGHMLRIVDAKQNLPGTQSIVRHKVTAE
jgi:hypothetical protein